MPDVDIFGLPLDQYLEATNQFTTVDEATQEPVGLQSEDEALWTMRRLAQAQRRMNEINRQANTEVERIEAWRRANVIAFEDTVQTCEALLSDYLIRVREDSADGRKSLIFPDGVVSSRIVGNKAEVEDRDAAIAWLSSHGLGDWIRVKKEVALSEMTGKIDFDLVAGVVKNPVTGEVIEGLKPIAGGVRTSVQITE